MRTLITLLVLPLALMACGDPAPIPDDEPPLMMDAGPMLPDMEPTPDMDPPVADAGPPDASKPDATPEPDLGPMMADAGPEDAGPEPEPDLGPMMADAGPEDAGTPDLGSPDLGPPTCPLGLPENVNHGTRSERTVRFTIDHTGETRDVFASDTHTITIDRTPTSPTDKFQGIEIIGDPGTAYVVSATCGGANPTVTSCYDSLGANAHLTGTTTCQTTGTDSVRLGIDCPFAGEPVRFTIRSRLANPSVACGYRANVEIFVPSTPFPPDW